MIVKKSDYPALHILSYGFLTAFCTVSLQAQVSVTTYHNDNSRTGQNLNETILTPANVNTSQFGELFVQPVDGYIYAQPLYMADLRIAGAVHDVVFVATENDSVYAFDANSNAGANAAPLWKVSFINPPAGITTVSVTDVNCGDLTPQIGITGTPVIDPSSNTLYAVAKTKENGVFFQRLHALDITTGAEKFGGPAVIQATVPGTGDGSVGGRISFNPLLGNQRPSLLLQNGLVYISWSSHCDLGLYHGWVIAYNAQSLQQAGVWPVTANGALGGIWESGGGPAADSSGNVFLATGNGTFDLNSGGVDAGDSIVKLGLPAGGVFPVLDYFTPYNQDTLSMDDQDLGSGGVLLFPALPSGAAHQNLLMGAGKQGTVYLVDRNNMGHYNGSGNPEIVQSLPGAIDGLFGTPVFWNNTVYLGGANDVLKAFSFNANNSGLLSASPVSSSTDTFGFPGTSPAISASGTSNGILWALQVNAFASSGPAVLRAYDATNLATELYNSTQNAQDTPGPAVKFAVPTIANGKVYVPTETQLAVYGIKGALPASPTLLSPLEGATGVSVTPTLSWTTAAGATSYTVYFGTSSPPPMATNTSLAGYSPTVLNSGTTYYWMIASQNASGTTFSAIWSFTTGNFLAQIATPVPGSTLTGTSITFTWNGGPASGAYLFEIGTTPGNDDIFSGFVSGTSQLVRFLPCDGSALYAQISTNVNGEWQPPMTSTYTAVRGCGKFGAGDFNGDGRPDLLWQNNASAQVTVNYYGGPGGASYLGWNWLNNAGVPGWKLVGAGDFDGNGVPDLVWQNSATRQVTVNYYGGPEGASYLGFNWLNNVGVPGWTVVAVADFDGNGVPDLVWQNDTTAQVTVNYYGGAQGATYSGWNWLNNAGVPGWKVVGAADFDGNGVPDLVWQNTATAQVTVNYYGGTGGATYSGWNWLNNAGAPGWTVVGANDYDGNGVPDLVWENNTTGQVTVNYYGGPGGAGYLGWNWLNSVGNAGWTAVVPR